MRMQGFCTCWAAVAFGVAITSSTTSLRVTNSSIAEHEISTADNSVGSVDTVGSADAEAEVAVRHILHFSDVHLNLSESLNATDSAKIPIAYGDDTPVSLLVSALDYAKELIPDPDLFLYTGDHVVHGELSDEYLVGTLKTNVAMMAKYYSTKDNGTVLDVSAILGNSDTSPDYTMNVTDPETEVNPTISLVSGAWEDTLPESNLKWFNRRGYLSYDYDDNLAVITLNTLPYSRYHRPDTSHLPDPFKQFEWLNATLLELRKSSKFAYIAGHIPPIIDSYSGSAQWNETYIKTYKQIVSQYADVIKAQFFGHIHSVEFRLPITDDQAALIKQNGVVSSRDYSDSSQLVPLFMAAAISPMFGNNPGFMIWDFDATSYDILDFSVHGSNISSTSQTLQWQSLFKASTEYDVDSLNSSQISSFVKRAAANAELLEEYYYNSKAQSRLQESCRDIPCQAQWLCTMYWWSTAADYKACVASTKKAKSQTPAVKQSTTLSAGSLLLTSAMIILGGIAAIAAFVLVTSRVCRRCGNNRKIKLMDTQRVHFAAIA